MREKWKPFLVCLSLLLVGGGLVPSFGSEGEERTIVTEGSAPLTDHNEVAARNKALSDFQRRAVVQTVEELIGTERSGHERERLNHAIVDHFEGYVRSFRILSEGVEEGSYRVKGEAVVARERLKEEIRRLGIPLADQPSSQESQEDAPPTLVWQAESSCDEQIGDEGAGDFFEHTLSQALADSGITVVTSEGEVSGDNNTAVARGGFFCFSHKLQCRIVLQYRGETVTIEEEVPLEGESPSLMDAVMTLAEIVRGHIVHTINTPRAPEKGSTPPPNDQSPPTPSETSPPDRWQIVIKGPQSGLLWEKLYHGLRDGGILLQVSRILITPEAFIVETPEISEEALDAIKRLTMSSLRELTVEQVDPSHRQLMLHATPSGM